MLTASPWLRLGNRARRNERFYEHIFREVDEDVRRDKAAEFWAKYQNYVIGLAALIVLATAGYRFYDYRREQTAEAAGAAFQQALTDIRDGKNAEAAAAIAKLTSDAPKGYQVLARFADAALKAKADAKAGPALMMRSPMTPRSIR